MPDQHVKPPAGPLRTIPLLWKIAAYVIGLFAVAAVLSGTAQDVEMVVGMLGGIVLLGNYSARRRCIHCGHTPRLAQSDFRICENCRKPEMGIAAARHAAAVAVIAIAVAISSSGTALAQTESVSVSAAASAVVGAPVTITAQGVADGSHNLFVFVGTGGCAEGAPSGEEGRSGVVALSAATGDPLAAGDFSRAYTYTPPSIGTYSLCAYLSTTATDYPDASATDGGFAASRPAGSITLSVSSNPLEHTPVAITVSGSTAAALSLFAYVGGNGCVEGAPSSEAGRAGVIALSSVTGDPVVAGTFTRTYTYTPPTVGSYSLCAYLSYSPTVSPDAQATGSFTAAVPPGYIIPIAPSNGAGVTLQSPLVVTFDVTTYAQAFNVYYSHDPALGSLVAAYQANPESSEPPSVNLSPDAGLTGLGPGEHTVTLPAGPPGVYYWDVSGAGDNGSALTSGVRSMRVAAAPPRRMSARLSERQAAWGTAGRLTATVATTPWESLTVALEHHRRVVVMKRSLANRDGTAVLVATWRCPLAGAFTVVVTANDENGHRLVRRTPFRARGCGPKPKRRPGGGGGGSPAPTSGSCQANELGYSLTATWTGYTGGCQGAIGVINTFEQDYPGGTSSAVELPGTNWLCDGNAGVGVCRDDAADISWAVDN